jgi:hypothetical protein
MPDEQVLTHEPGPAMTPPRLEQTAADETTSSCRKRRILRLSLLALAYAMVFVILLARASTTTDLRQRKTDIFVSDGYAYYMYLPSLVIDHDLDFENELARNPIQRDAHGFHNIDPRTGLRGNGFQVGCAVLWAPFFLLAHLAVTALAGIGVPVARDGFGLAYELPTVLGAFTYVLLGVWYARRLVAELWGAAIAQVVAVYLLLATGVAAYLWFEPYMSHGLSFTLITMLFYYLHRVCQTRDLSVLAWMRLGLLLGLIALVRAPDVIVGLAVAWVGLAVGLRDEEGRFHIHAWEMAKCAVTLLLFAGIAFIPQLLVWKVLHDAPLLIPPNSSYDRTRWTDPDVLNYFFSLKRGIFVWTPLLLPATVGLVLGMWRGPAILRAAVLVLAVAVYFNSAIWFWWRGCSFGERRLVDFSVIFALGLGYLFSLRPAWTRRVWLHALGAVLIALNWSLMVRYYTHDLPEYGDVSWSRLYVENLTFPQRFVDRFLHR